MQSHSKQTNPAVAICPVAYICKDKFVFVYVT